MRDKGKDWLTEPGRGRVSQFSFFAGNFLKITENSTFHRKIVI